MIYQLLRLPCDKWKFMGFSQHKRLVRQRLSWLHFRMISIPPHFSPWSFRDELFLLILLSTTFSDKTQMIAWLKEHFEVQLSKRQQIWLKWIFPIENTYPSLEDQIKQASDEQLYQFTFDVLERLLLWDDPDPSWFSVYFSLVGDARELYKGWKEKEYLNNKPFNKLEYFGRYYYWSPPNAMFICYRIYEQCANLYNQEAVVFDIKTLSLQAYAGLLHAIVVFLQRQSHLKGLELEQKYLHLQTIETAWCRGRLHYHTLADDERSL